MVVLAWGGCEDVLIIPVAYGNLPSRGINRKLAASSLRSFINL